MQLDSEKLTSDNSFFLHEVSECFCSTDRMSRFKIKESYGDGEILIHELFPGFSLCRNNFRIFSEELKNNRMVKDKDSVYFKIDYCLSRGYEFTDSYGFRQSVSAGESMIFTELDCFSSLTFSEGCCDTLSLVCRLDLFLPFLSLFWDDDGGDLLSCICRTGNNGGFLKISSGDELQTALLKLLRQVHDESLYYIRTAAMELLKISCTSSDSGAEKKTTPPVVERDRYHAALARTFIERNYYKQFTIDDMAKIQGINTSYLKSYFKKYYGTTIHSYKKKLRLQKAELLLRVGGMTIKEIMYHSGYSDAGRFSKLFKDRYGLSPAEYRSRKLKPEKLAVV